MGVLKRIGIVLPPTPGSWDAKSTAAPIVWREEDRYCMLYQGWESGGGWTRGGAPRLIGLALSEDGVHWEKHPDNPVLTPTPGGFDHDGFECGCVVRIGDEYWLYYSGFDEEHRVRIGLARSHNLVDWEKYDGNPILDIGAPEAWDCHGVAFPSVMHLRTEWLMIYGGYGPRSMQLGTALSRDGRAWVKSEDNPVFRQRGWHADPECPFWDAGIEVHHAFALGDYIAMFYEGIGRPGRYNIGVAYSPDGIAWARCPSNPLKGLTDPTVKQDMSVVHPWFLIGENILYYVEVLGASTEVTHRICAARINDDVLKPHIQPTLSYSLWHQCYITTEGAVSSAIPCSSFTHKSAWLWSSCDGVVIVEIDMADEGEWFEWQRHSVDANRLLHCHFTESFAKLRLRFMPKTHAHVSAWVTLNK